MSHILSGLALLCVVWAIVAAFLITADLQKRGVRVTYVWLRLLLLRYVSEYRRLTREQTGRTGPLFYHHVVPLNVALVLAVIIVLRGRA